MSFLLADLRTQSVANGVKLPRAFEVMKIASDGAFGREIVGQESPLAAGFGLIEDGIDHASEVGGFGASAVGQKEGGVSIVRR